MLYPTALELYPIKFFGLMNESYVALALLSAFEFFESIYLTYPPELLLC
jgi:hypothetical protein